MAFSRHNFIFAVVFAGNDDILFTMRNGQNLLGVALGITFLLGLPFASPANPYEAITSRNAFGLKPPTPETKPEPPAPPPSKIKLQGIATLFGRKQVLFKTQVPARPPEYPAARDLALVLSEGQRDGDIEVLEINQADGTVKFNNNGRVELLTMKDDADKPTPGAVPPVAGVGASPATPPSLPGLPPSTPPAGRMTLPGVNPGASTVVTPFGASESSRPNPAIPQRTLRTTPGAGGAPGATLGIPQSNSQSSYQPPASPLSVDEQMAMLAVQHAAQQGGATSGLLPPLPPRYRQP